MVEVVAQGSAFGDAHRVEMVHGLVDGGQEHLACAIDFFHVVLVVEYAIQ